MTFVQARYNSRDRYLSARREDGSVLRLLVTHLSLTDDQAAYYINGIDVDENSTVAGIEIERNVWETVGGTCNPSGKPRFPTV